MQGWGVEEGDAPVCARDQLSARRRQSSLQAPKPASPQALVPITRTLSIAPELPVLSLQDSLLTCSSHPTSIKQKLSTLCGTATSLLPIIAKSEHLLALTRLQVVKVVTPSGRGITPDALCKLPS